MDGVRLAGGRAGRALTPTDFLKFVLEPSRLATIGALAARPHTVGELAQLTGRREREVLQWLGELLHAGLAEHDDEGYRLVPEALRALATDLPQPPPPAPRVGYGMTEAEQLVLARFFRGEQLVEVPVARAKRLVVLERLALEFEPGQHYTEAEVNAVLTRWHPDYASLRRYLVDDGFLDRAEGRYWRAGGRVDTGTL